MIGGDGKDILEFGEKVVNKTEKQNNLNLMHNVSGFETININGNLTLFETIKVTGADEINLASGTLTLRIDPTVKNQEGEIVGHAFYNEHKLYTNLKETKLTSTGGALIIGSNGISQDKIINMKNLTIDKSMENNIYVNSLEQK